MKSQSELLEIRKEIKERKPKFTRQEYPVRKKLRELVWRRPKGIHSKMRDKKRGKRIQPSVGWKSPRAVCGLTKDGLTPMLIKNLNGLNNVTKNHIIILSGLLGNKKRIEILKKIEEKKLKILNVKDIKKEINDIVQRFQERKKLKETKLKSKKQEKKIEKKETKEEPKTEEDKKKQEKEDKRKLLEGKQ